MQVVLSLSNLITLFLLYLVFIHLSIDLCINQSISRVKRNNLSEEDKKALAARDL